MTKEKKQAEIRVSTLSRLYYIGVGCYMLRNEYKTFAGAVRGAERKGYEVINKDTDPMVEFLASEEYEASRDFSCVRMTRRQRL